MSRNRNPLYDRAVFRATHNSYAGGPRLSLYRQLDSGVRGLELDVTHDLRHLGVGHGAVGMDVSHRDNPSSNRLRVWLAWVRDWMAANGDHAPLALTLDVKLPLTSRDDRVSLSVLHRLCRDVFGGRLFAPRRAEPGWPRVNEMRGTVLLILSGHRKTRQRALRDAGRDPAVASNRAGVVIEVHSSPDRGSLWYWAGGVRDGRLDWLWHDRYGSGATPVVALNDKGHVVSISRAVGSDNLWCRVGRWRDGGRIDWGRARRLAQGRDPEIRIASPGGRTVEVCYEAPQGGRVLRRGRLNMGRDRVDWGGVLPGDGRRVPTRTTLADGRVLAVRARNAQLEWSLADGVWRPTTYAPLWFVEQQPGDPDWMTDLGPRFAAATAHRADWAAARLADGRVMRLWGFKRKHVTGPAVTLPAVDEPFADWYLDYMTGRSIS